MTRPALTKESVVALTGIAIVGLHIADVAVAAALVAAGIVFPLAFGYAITHVMRQTVPEAKLGAAHEYVSFRTSDGLELQGWYVPSKNGAAVIAFSSSAPPPNLTDLAPKIEQPLFVIWAPNGGQYRAHEPRVPRARGPKQLWAMPTAKHVGGIYDQPKEYERRVVGFFDRALLDSPS